MTVSNFPATALEDNKYRFDIIDTGNGLSIEAQDKIFDAFRQEEDGAKKGGTGLGLAICKKQLELMGTDLLLKSEFNEGSHFYFTLVLPPAKNEIKEHHQKIKNVISLAPNFKVKALVIDDVKENREVLSKLFWGIGVDIVEAVNGKESVEKTKEYHPDIVFMDMRMPVMRGEEAIKPILEEFGNEKIKIVAITASAFDRRRVFYLEMRCHQALETFSQV